jgi:hypothetical protein
MSKIVYLCFKDPVRYQDTIKRKLEIICERIIPDNIHSRPPKIRLLDNIAFGIANPTTSILESGKSVILGMPFGASDLWWETERAVPDGSFSMFRSGNGKTQVYTDFVGSRSVWYYKDDDIFIASSSQRAIVMLLGSFETNTDVFPWMLSTGSLGPFISWDRRIKLLASNSSISLDHQNWELTENISDVVFKDRQDSDSGHEQGIQSALNDTFSSINIDFEKWALPLSGGFDSRAMLCLFKRHAVGNSAIRTITWGLKKVINQAGNDAFIAKKLANHFNVEHKYYSTDISSEPIEAVFKRFLVCGEGRIDHVGGYMDGFQIWKTLFEDGVEGIIRGDEGFGRLPVISPLNVRKHVEVALCSDYPNLSGFENLNIEGQKLPDQLTQRVGESLESWRDRLYHQYRMPVVLAALSDLKLPYVEVISPLLSRRILEEARALPDNLRSDKNLFKRIVVSLSPNIEYATSSAIGEAGYLLKNKAAVDLFRAELISENCKALFPKTFLSYILDNIKSTEQILNRTQLVKSFLKRFLPASLIKRGSKLTADRNIGINTLAFRVYMISRMNLILKEDAQAIKNSLLSLTPPSV